MAPPRISSFLVKVASRCNLDCDYCYVYHHADQSWRDMPRLLSEEDQTSFVKRLAEYVEAIDLKRVAVIFHGGEPLLAGAEKLAKFAENIRGASQAKVDIGLQTNGILLSDEALELLEAANIGVSISLDGPRSVNDKHRTSRKGRSSFDKTFEALLRLKQHPAIFSGVIAVIDASTPPEDIFSFFDEHQPPRLDFLLPDAHHLRQPPGRDLDTGLYERWLIDAFDLWLDRYSHLPVRTFEALLDSVSGLPSGTDAFGFGDVSLLSIETDGSYHDLDVLKVTTDGATRLSGTLADTSIAQATLSPAIETHRRLLQKEGLCARCQTCPIVEICGGGSLPHRFGQNGFDNPTVYCREMQALISHVRARLHELLLQQPDQDVSALPAGFELDRFDKAEDASDAMDFLCGHAQRHDEDLLRKTLETLIRDTPEKDIWATAEMMDSARLIEFARRPGTVSWRQVIDAQINGRTVFSVDGNPLKAETSYLEKVASETKASGRGFRIGEDDAWLRLPFGQAIHFEDQDVAQKARPLVDKALDIIEEWRPALAAEMRKACSAIQFVRDPLAHPDKIVSFSDNSVPGALYVSVVQGDGFIDPYDLADSLIHEHRHQKLYLLERLEATVHPTTMTVISPWREDPRPPSGLLHAVFVFIELRRFWQHVREHGPERLHNRAINQLSDTDTHLTQAFATLKQCPLTEIGRSLVSALEAASEPELSHA